VIKSTDAGQRDHLGRRHGKEIHRREASASLWFLQECNPAFYLVGIDRPAWQVTLHRDLADPEPEPQQLTVDPWCTRSILHHQANQTLDLRIDSRPS